MAKSTALASAAVTPLCTIPGVANDANAKKPTGPHNPRGRKTPDRRTQ